MLISDQTGDHSDIPAVEANKHSIQNSKHKNSAQEVPELTPRQRQKQDAADLAELIYDMFDSVLSSAKVGAKSVKGNNDAE